MTFRDYQGTRRVLGIDSGLIPVPSAADKTGNLSDVASQLTGTVTGGAWANAFSQELGYPVPQGEAYYTGGCSTASQCVFPGAAIPQSAFSAPAKNLLQDIPSPNVGSNFSTSAYEETLRDDKGSVRLDANTRFGMLTGCFSAQGFQVGPDTAGNRGARTSHRGCRADWI